ncbi:FAD:protein FMN transferase [Janthinobacterium sp. 1_2014MBL_MicDiv]|uniref:FAD:protein FMN transferase n=1 Tax=Janthinobacterium sp. 1_2014MBL_MicDiv TaxID=1644131 RepID=UPI0008F47CEE|nr:FAD:protein FMN transferase [Janthinobacterium sp. 1_2014MBL_MicDiv]APA70052.1 thiamine biosynthesis protein ApbE [Janthinobacterium sp. 1_2014MBL_MicDiv]
MQRRTFMSAAIGSVAGMAGLCLPGSMARGTASASGVRLYRGAALAFGTTIAVTVLHREQRQAELAIEDALHAARNIDRLMSIYSPASQVFQLNRDGRLSRPDPHLLAVLAQAQALSQWSDGAFDVTVQPLWQLFRAAAGEASLPLDAQRRAVQARVGWRQLAWNRREVRFLQPGMALTLNGLAQGYAADMALAAVRARGVRHALLDTGEFIARGQRAVRQPWTLGIRDPRDSEILTATLKVEGRSVATSGDYECTFTPDFAHHHIFDPSSGDSPLELASVTVVAPTGLLADGLSTTFMVTGAARAHAMTAQMDGVDLMTIDKQGRRKMSPGFPRLL